MTLRASARAMAVGFAAFPVLCPERSSAEVVDVCKLSQQLAALFDKIGVIPSSHPQLRLYPNKGNRHPSENTAFLKFSKSGRAPLLTHSVDHGTDSRYCAQQFEFDSYQRATKQHQEVFARYGTIFPKEETNSRQGNSAQTEILCSPLVDNWRGGGHGARRGDWRRHTGRCLYPSDPGARYDGHQPPATGLNSQVTPSAWSPEFIDGYREDRLPGAIVGPASGFAPTP